MYVCVILVIGYSGTSLFYGHHWDWPKCPDYRVVRISEVVFYTKSTFGTPESVLINVLIINAVII